jgi:hypothetical protein
MTFDHLLRSIHMAWGETPAYTSIGNVWVANQQ